MKKIYHLSTCTTCQRILKEIPRLERFVLQDIKTEPIIPKQLDAMRELAGSYEALFSRRALKFRAMGLHEKQLAETDYRGDPGNTLLEKTRDRDRWPAVRGQCEDGGGRSGGSRRLNRCFGMGIGVRKVRAHETTLLRSTSMPAMLQL